MGYEEGVDLFGPKFSNFEKFDSSMRHNSLRFDSYAYDYSRCEDDTKPFCDTLSSLLASFDSSPCDGS